ncbi:MAG TPA: VOC family protein [Candidatus Acidoferrales bacterium]|nr:VOC family protein [Candidatus Acidoferrales bacterium]
MTFTGLTPMLWVDDLNASVAFYREILGFECLNRTDGWASLQRDGVELMLSLPNQHEPYDRPVFSGSFYFRVDDATELWTRLKERVRVVYPMEDFEYGMREFAIRDLSGYILQFGQQLS